MWSASEAEACRLLRRLLPVVADFTTSTAAENLEEWRSFLESKGLELVDEQTFADVTRHLDDYLHAGVPLNQMLERANAVLPTAFRIEWWGRFENLLSGGSASAKRTRSWFRKDWWGERGKDAADAQPIAEDEVAQFAEALRKFGWTP